MERATVTTKETPASANAMSWSPLLNRSAGLLQRTCACGGTPGPTGECEECRKKRRLDLQTKLKISEPGDMYEKEADRVAELVVGTHTHSGSSSAPPHVAHFTTQSNGQADTAPASINRVPLGPGTPLEPELRQDMEERFGHDFSSVLVHSRGGVPQAALNAHAEVYGVMQRSSCARGGVAFGREKEDSEFAIQGAALSAVMPGDIQRDPAESCSIKSEPKEEGEEEEAIENLDPAETPIAPKRHAGASGVPEHVEARINASRELGSPLPRGVRTFMESRFGYDFSGVRVHTGAVSERLNRDVASLAFTTGSDIYFGLGQFRPDTDTGKHLLAHELAHVVQQSGGGTGMVREKAIGAVIARKEFEAKPYYTYLIKGAHVHQMIERVLRGEDDKLVTEAAIPGADRFSPKLNKIGVADLYKSDPERTVTGVKGLREVDSEADVITMNQPSTVGTRPSVTSAPTRPLNRPGEKAPRKWTRNFPESVSLGEIKPASESKFTAGVSQLESYKFGYEEFVKRVHTLSGGATRSSLSVTWLKAKIPDRINFDEWEAQHRTDSKDTTFDSIAGKRRLWIASIDNGLYVYTDFAKSLEGPPPKEFTEYVSKMRKSVADLRVPHPKTDLISAKPLPGNPQIRLSHLSTSTGPVRRVQRATKDRPTSYWSDRNKQWETERRGWAVHFRRALKTRFKDFREKVGFEKQIGRPSRTASPAEKKEVGEYKSLMFWSGAPGRFLGRIRWLLGGAWDKVLSIFEFMKDRMSGIRTRVKAVSEGTIVPGGWAKRLIQVIVGVAKIAVGAFIKESFNFFAACFHSAMDKVVDKIRAELAEKFAEELCKARLVFESSKERLDREWGDAIRLLEKLLAVIQDAKHWLDIASTLITLIRTGVQVVACLSPPALGCLWGLVAQLGIGTALKLVIGTQWFNDNIVTPTVRKLVREYGSPYYQSLVNRALGDDLKEYHCHIADDAIPSLNFEATGGLTGDALRKQRDAWETENQDEILSNLQLVFEIGKGKKVTKEELQELVSRVQQLNPRPEKLKAMLESARNPLSGKLKIEQAKAAVEKGELPESAPKERKIDYEKAAQANGKYQKLLGWDPLTFYEKPGIDANSIEFADAVYDMQQALPNVDADGILGEETLIAFYNRNKLKQDPAYREAVKMRDKKKAAVAKAAAEREARHKPPAAAPQAETFTLLNPEDCIPDPGRYESIRSDVWVNLNSPNLKDLVKKPAPDQRELTQSPEYVTLDIYIDHKHTYRIKDIPVQRTALEKVKVLEQWKFTLVLDRGVQVATERGPFVFVAQDWFEDPNGNWIED